MRSFDDVARKISRPPGAQNCARLNAMGDELATTNLIARFALAIPPFNYLPALKQCQTHVQLSIDVATARMAVLRSGSPAGREQNAALVDAFFEYDVERQYSAARVVDGFSGHYRLSRTVKVPTKPTFTLLEKGRLVPVSICGWKSLTLNAGQIRYWMTMLEEGLYSHIDYVDSPAEVVLFLEESTSTGALRQPLVIKRGDFDLLSPAAMREQAEIFARAQAAALPLAEALWNERQRKRHEEDHRRKDPDGYEPDSPGLFD